MLYSHAQLPCFAVSSPLPSVLLPCSPWPAWPQQQEVSISLSHSHTGGFGISNEKIKEQRNSVSSREEGAERGQQQLGLTRTELFAGAQSPPERSPRV